MDNMFKLPNIDLNFKMPDIHVPTPGEHFTEVIREQIDQLQAALQPDQELVVYCDAAGGEVIRALQFSFPRRDVAWINGVDREGNPTQIILHTDRVQITCKVRKLKPNTKRALIGFFFPEKSL
jgi:hypothetical protein